MLKNLRSWLAESTSFASRVLRRRRARVGRVETRLAVESLEAREVMDAQPAGVETRVNVEVSGNQRFDGLGGTAIATDAAGNYVVTWSDQIGGGDVFARRFDASGVALGDAFRVNTFTTGYQSNSTIAMNAAGAFVITWTDSRPGDSGVDVYARIYDASGVAQGDEFRVNSTTTFEQSFSSVAIDVEGDFVVTWTSYDSDGSGLNVYARRFDAAGVAQSGDVRVNTFTAGAQQVPRAAMAADGDFVITWTSLGQDGSAGGIYGQRYNAAGVVQGGEFQINTFTTNVQQNANVAMNADGAFVVVWTSALQDGNNNGVYGQRYDASGAPQGSEFRVAETTLGSQVVPTVDLDEAGDFVVAWWGSGNEGVGAYARRYNAAGVPQTGEFQVNTTPTGLSALNPGVAVDPNGDFVIAWGTYLSGGAGYEIYSQRYAITPRIDSVRTAGGNNRVDENERIVESTSALVVALGREMSTAGGTSGAGSVTNTANWVLTRNGVDVSSRIASVSYVYDPATNRSEATVNFTDPLVQGDYVLTALGSLTDASGEALDGNGDGTTGDAFSRAFHVATITTVGPETRVNTTTTGDQEIFGAHTVATDAAGNYVVVWSTTGVSSATKFVYGQRYNAAGVPQGSEFVVFSSLSTPIDPRVAMDADGDFVVVWSAIASDGETLDYSFRRYSAAGVAQSGVVLVNPGIDGAVTGSPCDVAMNAAGDFVVAWSGQVGSANHIFVNRYAADGTLLQGEQLVSTTTNTLRRRPGLGMNAEGDFVVVWTAFNLGGGRDEIYARRFDSSGVALGGEFHVNTYTTAFQNFPSAAMDAEGDFVVVWTSQYQDGEGDGIYARRYDAAGIALESQEFRINQTTANNQSFGTISMDADGDFVVAWTSYLQDGSQQSVHARRYNADGDPEGNEFLVNTYTNLAQSAGSVAMDADGDFVVVWRSSVQDGSGNGIYSQRYAENLPPTDLSLSNSSVSEAASIGTIVGSLVTTDPDGNDGFVYNFVSNPGGLFSLDADGTLRVAGALDYETATSHPITVRVVDQAGNEYTESLTITVTNVVEPPARVEGVLIPGEPSPIDEGERLVQNPTSVVVRFDAPLSTTGGTSGANSVTNPANWRLTRDGVDVSAQIASVSHAFNAASGFYEATVVFAAPLGQADYVLTALDSIRDTGGNALDGDGNGAAGGNFARSFRVDSIVPVGPEHRVNTTTADIQQDPSVATDAAGNYVVVWAGENQPGGASFDVYAQRYNAAGVAQGAEFRVNTTTANLQDGARVAMDADGDFVVVWRGFDQPGGSNGDVYAQRYNAAGVAQGGEFRVNATTASAQRLASVAMDADGDFVVVWQGSGQPGGASYDVFAQRYNAAGVAQGGEFLVNTTTLSDQQNAGVAMDADGDFVVVWTGENQPGGAGSDVYAQRYNAAGVAQGGEFLVNTTTADSQGNASVAMDADGGFVVVWRGDNQPGGSGDDVYAQRYNAAGQALGGEFRVNTTTAGSQQLPRVSMDADGDFVVVWSGLNQPGGSGDDVFAQRYNAAGVAQGGEFLVNLTTANLQNRASVSMDADGDFVVAWIGVAQPGGNFSDIYAQRFTLDLPITDLGLSPTVVLDAAPLGALVGTLTPTDGNANEYFVYELLDDGSGAFALDGDRLVVAGTIDIDATPTIDVTVRVTDRAGNQYTETLTITVVVQGVSDGDSAANQVSEGTTAGTTVGITGQAFGLVGTPVYSLSENAGGRFTIDSATGVVTVATGAAIDFESSSGSYAITVSATDGTTTLEQNFTVGVLNVGPSTPSDANAATNSVAENAAVGATVGITAASTDPAGPAVTYSLGDSAGGRFAIDPTSGVVTVAGALDFEGSSGSYTITVIASDGEIESTEQTFTITVTNSAPSTPTDADAAANTVAEDAAVGATVGVTASSSDPGGNPSATYSLSDDAGGRFAIDATSGVVTVAGALDFESSGGSYTITVVASAGALASVEQDFTITVTDVAPSAPTDANAATNSVAENAAVGTAVGITASAADPNGPAVVYSLDADAGGRFAIDSASGVVTVAGALDFESSSGSYSITVRATAGAQSSTQTFSINVTDVAPSTPIDSNGPTGGTVAPGAAAGTTVGLIASATDPGGPAVTYSLDADAAGRFVINATTGVVSVASGATITLADGSYTVTVRATAGALSSTAQFTIVVASTTPADSDAAPDSVVEGAATGTAVGVAVVATDSSGGAVTYELTDSAGGRFQIDATTGVVTVANGALIDRDTATSYTIVVGTRDSLSQPGPTSSFVIAVSNAAPATPTDSNAAANQVRVGATAGSVVGITAASTDPAGGTVTYSLADDADGRFVIDATTGVVTVASGATFTEGETPTIEITATDAEGLSSSVGEFTITVVIKSPLIVYGTERRDRIKIYYYAETDSYQVWRDGKKLPTLYTDVSHIEVYGYGGNDVLEVQERTPITAYLFGGDGNDRFYGGGNDVIVGGAGNDYLNGRGGRDVFIGGTGKDKILGLSRGRGISTATDADVMVGDETIHDGDLAALQAIAAAWSANDQTTVGSYLNETTIQADGARDSLSSASAIDDWLLSFELDSRGRRVDALKFQLTDRLN